MRCSSKTKLGKRCKKKARKNRKTCGSHGRGSQLLRATAPLRRHLNRTEKGAIKKVLKKCGKILELRPDATITISRKKGGNLMIKVATPKRKTKRRRTRRKR